MIEERSLARSGAFEAPVQAPEAAGIDIRQILDIIRRRRSAFVYVFIGVILVGAAVTIFSQKIYETSTKIIVPAASGPSLRVLSNDSPISSLLQKAEPPSVPTQMEQLSSSLFLQEAKDAAGVRTRPGVMPPKVEVSNLKTDNGQPTEIIEINIRGGDPEAISNLANKMVDLHQARVRELQTAGLKQVIRHVEDNRRTAHEQLQEATNALIEFRRKHKVVELTADREARAKQYVDLDSLVHEARSNLRSTQRHLDEVRERMRKTPEMTKETIVVENPQRTVLRDELAKLQLKETALAQDFAPGAPPLVSVQEQIQQIKELLKDEPARRAEPVDALNERYIALRKTEQQLEADLMKFRSELNAAEAAYGAQKGIVDTLGPAEIQFAALTAEKDRHQAEFALHAGYLTDLKIREQADPTEVSVLEKATVPVRPIEPRVPVNAAITLVLALFLGAGVAFLQEYMDDRVNDPADIERISGLPMLGHVPVMPPGSPRTLSQLASNSQIAEAYRGLRSSVGFASIDHPLRRLVVTSASKGEGKSLTSVNLAQAMALDGKRVILLDADLRRPSLHRVLGLPNTPGLSELLTGARTIEECLQTTQVENLQVVCSGPVPPNPAELIGSLRFEEIVGELEEFCDIVILDTPPCIPVTDPLIMAARADGVVLVVNAGATRKNAVRHAMMLLERARARTIGVVFNNVQANKGGYYYYTYYQYSGDGYYADTLRRDRSKRGSRRSETSIAPSNGGPPDRLS